MKIYYGAIAAILFFILSCENPRQKEERLVKQTCGSCHSFPEPTLLDKKTWEKKVLPEMAFRMGLNISRLSNIDIEDHAAVISTIPGQAMVTSVQWEVIKQYYLKNSPDSLINSDRAIHDTLNLFKAIPLRLPISQHASITVIQSDTLQNRILLGNRRGKVYELNPDFTVKDSVQLSSAPSKILPLENGNSIALLMGIMDPNERHAGKIIELQKQGKPLELLDSLQRPVDFQKIDLNNDNVDDYVVCAFGNYTGSLTAYESYGNGKFRKHLLSGLPGVRKIIVKDFDDNGMEDILVLMTQGDERIVLFYNQGNFKFRMATLLRFQPVYGSSYFDVADFNNDGKFDIIYTNGDNADYSPILKPYHGVRIFLNNGTNEFKESWFYPMHGASQIRVADFDQDGDLDIAAISFFPDFNNHPEQGFVYFENTGENYIPQVTSLAAKGRWITMEVTDYDKDGDTDILLGSLLFPNLIPTELFRQLIKEQISILVLRNELK